MRAYTVHAPPEEPIAPEKFLFVKDGFSWPAFFFPVLWILWHGLWLTLLYYAVFVLVVAWTGRLAGDESAVALAVLGAILFGLEANNIRRLSLDSRGWREVGGSHGRNLAEAEARFFGSMKTEEPGKGAAIAAAAYTPAAREAGADEPILGLFPEPER